MLFFHIKDEKQRRDCRFCDRTGFDSQHNLYAHEARCELKFAKKLELKQDFVSIFTIYFVNPKQMKNKIIIFIPKFVLVSTKSSDAKYVEESWTTKQTT